MDSYGARAPCPAPKGADETRARESIGKNRSDWPGERGKWSGRLDLNQRPHAPQACALPGCATSRPAEGSRMQSGRRLRVQEQRRLPLRRFTLSLAFEDGQERAEGVARVEQNLATDVRRRLGRARGRASGRPARQFLRRWIARASRS